VRVLSTHEVAERLGVSPASVRRILAAYERVSEEGLPRDKRGEWVVPEGVMGHLEVAHALVRERRLPWGVALAMALGKDAPPPPLARRGELEEVLARLYALEKEHRALRALLEEQTALLKRLTHALEAAKRKRPWWRFWGHKDPETPA